MTDSNIIIYSYDPSEPQKQERAIDFIERQIDSGEFAVSTQVLHEFYNRATKPNRLPALNHEQAVVAITKIVDAATVYPVSLPITRLGLYSMARYQMSLWDALIWAVAKEYGDPVIYTKDIQSQPEIEGVRYINPLV